LSIHIIFPHAQGNGISFPRPPNKKESINVQAAQKTAAGGRRLSSRRAVRVIGLWLYTFADAIKAMTMGVTEL